MANTIDFGKLANTVLTLQQRVTTLEKVVDKLNSGSRVTQSEISQIQEQSKDQVKKDWSELDLN